jgi:hypothetical protein
MTNKVYTYYQFLASWGDQGELMALWAESWRRMGWDPVVLNQGHARNHPQWVDFINRVQPKFNSINPAGYDEACWQRWLAFDVMGGGLMVDYDVINVNWRHPVTLPPGVLILEQHRVPCAVAADSSGASNIVNHIMSHEAAPRGGHYSDMYMAQNNMLWPHDRVCREYDGYEWRGGNLVHVATGACHRAGRRKVDVARELIGGL